MRKHELLTQISERKRVNETRSNYERQIVRSLPDDLDVTRVFCGPQHLESRSNCKGLVEITVGTLNEALALLDIRELQSADLSRVIMQREEVRKSMPTLSFYPNAAIPQAWHEREGVTITPVYPVLFQMMPTPPPVKPLVYLEWFMYAGNVLANVRVFIEQHGTYYRALGAGGLAPERLFAYGYPRGDVREYRMTHNGPQYVTVYWDTSCFNGEFTLRDLLMEVTHA